MSSEAIGRKSRSGQLLEELLNDVVLLDRRKSDLLKQEETLEKTYQTTPGMSTVDLITRTEQIWNEIYQILAEKRNLLMLLLEMRKTL